MVLGLTERVKASTEGEPECLSQCANSLAPLCYICSCEIIELPDFDPSPPLSVTA